MTGDPITDWWAMVNALRNRTIVNATATPANTAFGLVRCVMEGVTMDRQSGAPLGLWAAPA
jgi:hypothetical protein